MALLRGADRERMKWPTPTSDTWKGLTQELGYAHWDTVGAAGQGPLPEADTWCGQLLGPLMLKTQRKGHRLTETNKNLAHK